MTERFILRRATRSGRFTLHILWFVFFITTMAVISLWSAFGEASVRSIEPVKTPDHFELRVVTDEEPTYRVWRTRTPPKVVVDVAGALDAGTPRKFTVTDGLVREVRIDDGPLGTRAVIDLAYLVPFPEVVREDRGVTVKLPRHYRTVEETLVERGVWYGSVRSGKVGGPQTAKYLKVDLTQPGVEVHPYLAGKTFSLAPLRQIAAREGALGGVNGGFYHWSGRPLGLLVIDGKIVSEDIYERAAFGVSGNGTPFIRRLDTSLYLTTAAGTRIAVDGINRPRHSGEIIVYTSAYGRLPKRDGERLFVQDQRVMLTSDWEKVPENAFVVDGEQGDSRLFFTAGTTLSFGYQVQPGVPGGVSLAVGGGPLLIADGRLVIGANDERFKPDVLIGRAPRTAVGITASGKLLLVVVDGRHEDLSIGATIHELAQLMRDLGAVSAMNLDGGGSSTMVLRGLILNHPSEGEERPISSGLLLFAGRDAS